MNFFVREEEIRARERGWGGDKRRRRRARATAADIHFTGQRQRSKTSGPVVIDQLTKEYFSQEYFGHLACLARSVDVAPPSRAPSRSARETFASENVWLIYTKKRRAN